MPSANNSKTTHKHNKTKNLQQSHLQVKLETLLKNIPLPQSEAGGIILVYQQGDCIAKAAYGLANTDQLWYKNQLSLNFSTGKGVLATLVHVLVSKGILKYDEPIADVWRVFAANGKQEITLRQVLTHQAGLFNLSQLNFQDVAREIVDWQVMLDKVAHMAGKPSLELNAAAKRKMQQLQNYQSDANNDANAVSSQMSLSHNKDNGNVDNSNNRLQADAYYDSVYSALIYGWVLGGLIEAATKTNLQQALQTYLTKPLGIADECFFCLHEDLIKQIAKPIDKNTKSAIDNSSNSKIAEFMTALPKKVAQSWLDQLDLTSNIENLDQAAIDLKKINQLYFNSKLMDYEAFKAALSLPNKTLLDYYNEPVLTACIPAANCTASAHALATIYTMLSQRGKYNNIQLIDSQTFKELSSIQVHGFDAVMPAATGYDNKAIPSMYWRLGYHRVMSREFVSQTAFGHMGYNGSMAWCDPDKQLSVVYIHNQPTTMFTDVMQFAINECVLSAMSD